MSDYLITSKSYTYTLIQERQAYKISFDRDIFSGPIIGFVKIIRLKTRRYIITFYTDVTVIRFSLYCIYMILRTLL